MISALCGNRGVASALWPHGFADLSRADSRSHSHGEADVNKFEVSMVQHLAVVTRCNEKKRRMLNESG